MSCRFSQMYINENQGGVRGELEINIFQSSNIQQKYESKYQLQWGLL
jgi:hypothetical protein